jgi:hypothetical protein
MKKLLVALSLIGLCACANLERNAYVTIGSIGTSANAAIGAYMQYLVDHPATPDEISHARLVVKVYEDAMETARFTVAAYKSGSATKTTLNASLDALSAAASQMAALFSTKIRP